MLFLRPLVARQHGAPGWGRASSRHERLPVRPARALAACLAGRGQGGVPFSRCVHPRPFACAAAPAMQMAHTHPRACVRRPLRARARVAAKKAHPDLNKSDPNAAERFKRLTTAYSRALLESESSARREHAPSGGSSTSRSAPRESPRSRRGPAQPVDPRRYNVREWERAHYGMHQSTPTGDMRMSDMARQMQRQARASAARRQAPPRQTSFGALLVAAAAFTTVWTLVAKAAKSHVNPAPPRYK